MHIYNNSVDSIYITASFAVGRLDCLRLMIFELHPQYRSTYPQRRGMPNSEAL